MSSESNSAKVVWTTVSATALSSGSSKGPTPTPIIRAPAFRTAAAAAKTGASGSGNGGASTAPPSVIKITAAGTPGRRPAADVRILSATAVRPAEVEVAALVGGYTMASSKLRATVLFVASVKLKCTSATLWNVAAATWVLSENAST